MGMFNFVLDSFKGEIFDFKVKRRVLVASTVSICIGSMFLNYSYECVVEISWLWFDCRSCPDDFKNVGHLYRSSMEVLNTSPLQ